MIVGGTVTLALLALFGVLAGAGSGLLGVGGGTFVVPYLVLVVGLSQHEAQATSLLVVLPTAIVAAESLRRRGVGDVRLGLRIGVVGVAGGVAGALLALVLPASLLRLGFAVLLAGVGVRLLLDARRAAGRRA